MSKKFKIFGVIPNIKNAEMMGACEAYRQVYPLKALEKLGCETVTARSQDVEDAFRKGYNPFHDVDVIIFMRIVAKENSMLGDLATATKAMRAMGIAVIVDYDDDYTNAHRKVHEGYVPDLKAYSAVSVTTPHLAAAMKSYASKVVVHPNGIVPELLDASRFNRIFPGLVIGLTGGTSHVFDWPPACQALISILNKRPDLTVFVSGYVPEILKGVPGVKTLREMVHGADVDNFFVPLSSYGGVHANIDILLCPVDPDDKFNWSKSNLKSIEGMASARRIAGKTGGSCVIATGGKLPIYKDSVIHEKTGLLVDDHHNPDAWEEAILRVVNNVELRNKLQIAGYQHCMKQFTVQALAPDRLATYRRLAFEAKKNSREFLAELTLPENTQ